MEPLETPSLIELQSAFSQFEILECIGRGGMGAVYKARQPQLDRLLALKILLPHREKDPAFAERFSREARALAKLSHPNIVSVHDFGETGGFFWLTMEYVDGVNLRQAMQAARFTPAQALAVIPELCAALQYAHDHGILHRDIKPENILLDGRGRVKIADFGIARIVGDDREDFTLTHTGSVLGSTAYIAPEQIERPHDVDHRADLYSLGVVFYEMLTGELPLGRFPAPSEKSSSAPQLDEVVFRILEKERERRYQSADALREGVETADSKPVPRPGNPKSADLWPRVLPVSIALLAGGLIASVVGHCTSTAILGCGLISLIIGQLGCWALLMRMKSGREGTGHRKLLIAVAFVPVLLGMLWLICINPLRGFIDVIYSGQPVPLLWVFLPFVAAVCAGRLLWKRIALPAPAADDRGSRNAKRAGILGIAVMILALLLAKHLVVNLKSLNSYHERSVSFRQARTLHLNDGDTELVKNAIREAAGEYSDFYQTEFPASTGSQASVTEGPKSMRVSILTDPPWSRKRADAHFESFERRLRSLLPVRIRMEQGQEVQNTRLEGLQRTYHSLARVAMPSLIAAASLLVIFTRRRAFFASLGCGMIATVLLSAYQDWPTPGMLPPTLADRPALSLLKPEPEPPDPAASLVAFHQIHEAAKSRDLAAVKLGMSEEASDRLEQINQWEKLMALLGEEVITVTGNDKATRSLPEDANDPLKTTIYRKGKRSGGSMTMVFEDGEWRLAEIPHELQ